MRIKKILSLAVVLAMVLTVVPMFGLTASAATAYGEGANTYSIEFTLVGPESGYRDFMIKDAKGGNIATFVLAAPNDGVFAFDRDAESGVLGSFGTDSGTDGNGGSASNIKSGVKYTKGLSKLKIEVTNNTSDNNYTVTFTATDASISGFTRSRTYSGRTVNGIGTPDQWDFRYKGDMGKGLDITSGTIYNYIKDVKITVGGQTFEGKAQTVNYKYNDEALTDPYTYTAFEGVEFDVPAYEGTNKDGDTVIFNKTTAVVGGDNGSTFTTDLEPSSIVTKDTSVDVTSITYSDNVENPSMISKGGTGSIAGILYSLASSGDGDFGTLRYAEVKFTAPSISGDKRLVAEVTAQLRENNVKNDWMRPYISKKLTGEPKYDPETVYVKNETKTSYIDITDIVDQGVENTVYLQAGKYSMNVSEFKLALKEYKTVKMQVVTETGDTVNTVTETSKYFEGASYTPNIGNYYVYNNKLYEVISKETIVVGRNTDTAKVTVREFKNIVGDNLITQNAGFEEGLDGWTSSDGKSLSEDSSRFTLTTGVSSEGSHALLTKSSKSNNASDNGNTFDTSWTVEPDTRYFIGFDATASVQNGGGNFNQYAWIYTAADDMSNMTTYGDYKNSDNGHINLAAGKFIPKGFVVKTAANQTKLGIASTYFNDADPIYDNFVLYKLDYLDTDKHYNIVYTDNGQENGKVIAKENNVEEVTEDGKVKIEADRLAATRVGKNIYSNNTFEDTYTKGKTYYVSGKVLATITGNKEVKVTAVGDYAANLPKTVKLDASVDTYDDEVVNVTWDVDEKTASGEVAGTIDGIDDLKASATVERLEKTYSLPDTKAKTVQNHQDRAEYIKFPQAVTKDRFVIEFTVKINRFKDQWVFLDNSGKGVDYFGNSQICLGFNEKFVPVNGTGDGKRVEVNDPSKNDGGDDVPIMDLTVGGTYTVLVDVDAQKHKYNATIVDSEGNSASSGEHGYRKNNTIDALVCMNNGEDDTSGTKDDSIEVTNIQVHHAEVPAAPTAELGWNGTDFTINFDGGKAGQTIKVYHEAKAGGTLEAVTEEAPAELTGDQTGIAITPENTNRIYAASIVDAVEGVRSGAVSLYSLVVDEILKVQDEETIPETKKSALNKIIADGGIYYSTENQLDSVTDKILDLSGAETETLTVEVVGKAKTLGLGFILKGNTIYVGSTAIANTLEGAEDGKVYTQLSINKSTGTITLDAGTAEAITLSLDSVNIEFVETLIEELEAEGADAAQDFIPEL